MGKQTSPFGEKSCKVTWNITMTHERSKKSELSLQSPTHTVCHVCTTCLQKPEVSLTLKPLSLSTMWYTCCYQPILVRGRVDPCCLAVYVILVYFLAPQLFVESRNGVNDYKRNPFISLGYKQNGSETEWGCCWCPLRSLLLRGKSIPRLLWVLSTDGFQLPSSPENCLQPSKGCLAPGVIHTLLPATPVAFSQCLNEMGI